MKADDLELLFELFENTPRQGPGSVETTRRALRLLPGSLQAERVLDLGCGTGGSTIVLAQHTGARVTAVDIHPPFLARLRARAEECGLADRITTVAADMANAASLGVGFDLIWAEGSAYSIGFENALRRWRPLLRAGGCLVVTELVWFVTEPSARARAFFADVTTYAARSACRPATGMRTTPASKCRSATQSRGGVSSRSMPPFDESGRSMRPSATSTATCAWSYRSLQSRPRRAVAAQPGDAADAASKSGRSPSRWASHDDPYCPPPSIAAICRLPFACAISSAVRPSASFAARLTPRPSM